MLDIDFADGTGDEIDDAVEVNFERFELGVEALDEAVELEVGGSGARRSFKVVGLFNLLSLDVDTSDDEFSNISLISFIF